jgi:hypothetical protein
MHRSEESEIVACSACGAEISLRGDRVFAFGAASALCWECALGRGGRYDAVHERWEEDPRVADLREDEV